MPAVIQKTIERATPFQRLISGLIASFCLIVLLVALKVSPSPTGSGTHQQLDLPACSWMERGVPCPTCGMTTAFSHVVRGQLLSAFLVQPAGAVFAILCFLLAGVMTYVTVFARQIDYFVLYYYWKRIVFSLIGIFVLSWLMLYSMAAFKSS